MYRFTHLILLLLLLFVFGCNAQPLQPTPPLYPKEAAWQSLFPGSTTTTANFYLDYIPQLSGYDNPFLGYYQVAIDYEITSNELEIYFYRSTAISAYGFDETNNTWLVLPRNTINDPEEPRILALRDEYFAPYTPFGFDYVLLFSEALENYSEVRILFSGYYYENNRVTNKPFYAHLDVPIEGSPSNLPARLFLPPTPTN